MLKNWLEHIEEGLIAFLLAAMTVVTFAQVVARYVFNYSFVWALELTGVMFAWLIFVGMSYGVRVGAHIGVDAVVKSLSIDEFTKILVFGDQDPCILYGCFKDDVVANSFKFLSHPPDIMSVATNGIDNSSVHALIGEESHADSRSPTE